MKYRAFLSYSHTDRKWARWLHRALEAYRPPKHLRENEGRKKRKRLSPIFRDREELPSAASLSDVVNDALAESEALIVICSPAAANSRWVNEEIRTFRQLGRADRIFCIIVEGEPGVGNQLNCFPPALIETDATGAADEEPVAADARTIGDGKRNAMLKVAAGLLGVGFDELKQRDLRRYQQRLAVTTVASLVIAAITITLAVTATIARDEANVRRQQAENLIDFMLGDLQDQLREIGRLDVYQGIGDKAMEYFSLLDQDDESDASLSQRAKNQRQIGEVRQEQGNLGPALEAFSESLRIMEELASRNPSNPETLVGLANSYYYVGLIHWQRNQLSDARHRFEQVIPIVDSLRTSDPDNTDWLIESAYAYTNLGRVQELEGRLTDAQQMYQGVMQFNQQLTELEPDELEWQLELGFAHNNLGKVIASLGRIEDAKSHYRKDVEIKTRLLRENPDHNIWRSYQAVSEYHFGRLLTHSGQIEEGISHLESALASFLELTEQDPEQTGYVFRQASIERELGDAHFRGGQLSRARDLATKSLTHFEQLLMADDGSARWLQGIVSASLLSVAIETAQRNTDAAGDALDVASRHLVILLDQNSNNRESQLLALRKDLLSAHLLKSSDPEAASAYVRTALQRLERTFPDTADPWVLEQHAEALMLLNRTDDASVIRDRLREMQFRDASPLYLDAA